MPHEVQDPSPSSAPRLRWVDVAKALAIVLVALHHSVVFAGAAGWLPPLAVELNAQIGAVRMPLFFLAAGLFAHSALTRPWPVVLRRRVAFFAYLYLLWTLVRFILFQVVPDVRPAGLDGDLTALVVSPVLPGTGLWFIYALILFSVLAKLTLRVPLWLQLGGAAAASASFGSGLVAVDSFAWRNMFMYYVFFLVGMHFRRTIVELVGRTRPWHVLVLALCTVAALYGVRAVGARSIPGTWLLVSCVAVAFGLAASSQLDRTRLADRLSHVGRNTLPVYLIHVPVVALLVAGVERLLEPAGPVGAGLTLLVATTVVVLSLRLSTPLERAAPWLFALPMWIDRVLPRPLVVDVAGADGAAPRRAG